MEIRYITPEDSLAELSSIYERSWKYAYRGIIPQNYLDSIPEGRWAGSLSRPGLQSLVMLDKGRLIGTAAICPSRWESFPDWGEIVSIYFLPEYMGKGLGGQLLDRCIGELTAQGFQRILLWVLEENHRARRFYERHGFALSDSFMDDLIGGKPLREVLYTYHK